jgi:hypothetical protein
VERLLDAVRAGVPFFASLRAALAHVLAARRRRAAF